MTPVLRARDPGLQPERTALSWQRTSFSSLVLALVILRSGYSRDSLLLICLGYVSVAFSAVLIITSYRRQKILVTECPLANLESQRTKGLICASLLLNAVAVIIEGVLALC